MHAESALKKWYSRKQQAKSNFRGQATDHWTPRVHFTHQLVTTWLMICSHVRQAQASPATVASWNEDKEIEGRERGVFVFRGEQSLYCEASLFLYTRLWGLIRVRAGPIYYIRPVAGEREVGQWNSQEEGLAILARTMKVSGMRMNTAKGNQGVCLGGWQYNVHTPTSFIMKG